MAYSPAMMPVLDWPFLYLSKALGASVDELKLIVSFLLSYPLTGVLKRIPDKSPAQKNAFIVGVSLFYIIGLFSNWAGLRTLLWSSGGAYAIAYFIQGPFMPWIGFIFLMGHMSINHIHRQMVNDPTIVDITGAQMVLIMKLTAFCWNVHDGRLPDAELSAYQKSHKIAVLPDFLNYAGYVLFFPGLFAGPAFDYSDYSDYITTSMFELPPGTDPSKAPPTRRRRRIPRSSTPAMIKMAWGLAWIVGFLQFSNYFYMDYVLSDAFLKYGILRRVWYLHWLGITSRMKYYGVWSLTEGACILSGIGYRGIDEKTGKAQWDRLTNVKPHEIELAQNVRGYLAGWNINTNNWLRNYVYLRVTPKGQKPGFGATLATFITSAFWHGFYPGYYLAFLLGSLDQEVAKQGRRLLRPFFLTPDGKHPTPLKRSYDIFSWLITQLAFTFIYVPFVYLTLPNSLAVWSRVYFYGLIGTGLSFAFLNSPLKAAVVKKVKVRTGTAGASTSSSSSASASTAPGSVRITNTTIPTSSDPVPRTSFTPSSSSAIDFDDDDMESMQSTLGLPHDPEFSMDQIVRGVREEVEARRRRGSTVPDMKVLFSQKLEEFKRDQRKGRLPVALGGSGGGVSSGVQLQ